MVAVEREAIAVGGARRGRLHALVDQERWLGPLLIGPAVLYIVLLVGFPFFLALYYSLSNITVGNRNPEFVGLQHFVSVVGTTAFQTALKNTFIITFASQAAVIVFANILATALEKDFKGKWIVRCLILLPWVAPISIGSIGWLWILDSIYSVINWVLVALGLVNRFAQPMWLGVPHLALGSIIMINVWRQLPLATVILMAGLNSIPSDIHDAAAVDGAGFWRRLFQIRIPLVLPIMIVALLFGVVFTFTDMIVVFLTTRGGPYDATQVLANLAFFTGIQGGDLGEGAAIALFLFPILLAAAIIFLRIARRAEVT